ncbi:DUF6263 family protein [Sediminitomix flava]|uniref:Uncharacterized protein n=1 Tax=Sediminitomix flava TaxID=379075 RepID=A0A315Z6M0_SEDFL|nr:DUF6263 family protein [Sediminitomix flava]PWJ38620.1 hypothetical protein BC781_107210 [Sediminitomix flava]
MKKFILLVLTLGLFSQFVTLAQSNLRYKFVKGEKYSFTQKSNQAIDQQVMGQIMSITQVIEADYTMEVLEVLPTGGKVSMTYDRMKMSTVSQMGSVVVDSEAGEENSNPMNSVFKLMMKKPFTIELSDRGEITKVEGLEQIHDALLSEVDASMKMQIEGMLKQSFGEKTIKDSFKSALVSFPENAVSVGDTWSEQMDDITNIPGIVDVTWTYTSAEQLNAKVVYSPAAEPKSLNGAQVSKLEGTATYEAILNKNNWAKKFINKQDLSMEISAQGVTIPMTIESETTITLLD